jgi:hypothetical protein
LVGTDAKIVQSVIVRNGTGLSLRDFSGEVSENVIIDNEQNIFSDFPLKLGPNFIGQFRGRDMPSRYPLRGAATAVPGTAPIGHKSGT